MRYDKGQFCPILKEECIQDKCAFWTQVRGYDSNSGKEVDEYACAIAFLPMLLINTANETRKGAAATDSFKNEMAQQNKVATLILAAATKDARLIEG